MLNEQFEINGDCISTLANFQPCTGLHRSVISNISINNSRQYLTIEPEIMTPLKFMEMIFNDISQWRRPGAEFGGDGKIFRGPRFLNDVFFGKNFHFHAQNF